MHDGSTEAPLTTSDRPSAVADRRARDGVGVVVCTHTFERRPLLVALLDSIAAGTLVPDEVVVVVDRNPGLFAELSVRDWPLPVRVLASPAAGLAAARNAGWRALTTDLVAFIDDDAVASPSWLEELVAAAHAHDAGVVGGRIEPRWTAAEPDWYSPLLGWVVGCTYEGLPTTAARVRNVIGCNMLFRRDLLDRLGGFDPTLGRSGRGLAGCEETELCIRANAAGDSVFLIPGAPVEQVLPSERATWWHAIRRGWHEGRSKRMLVALHGPVLATESRYARALVRAVLADIGRAVTRRSRRDLARAVGLVAVLASTTAAYLLFGLATLGIGRSPDRAVPAPASGTVPSREA
jgi:GT2 family glycosyltransferase